MHHISFAKIVAAGFIFYRSHWDAIQKTGSITWADAPGKWKLHEKGFKTKAALDRAMLKLLKDDPLAITEQ